MSFLIGFLFYFDYCCGGHREKQIHGQRFPQIQSNNISLSRESIENLELIIFCLRQISQILVFNNLWIFNQVEPPPGVNIWSVNRWSTFRGKENQYQDYWKWFEMNILQISPFLAHLPSVNGCGSLKSSCVERTVLPPSPLSVMMEKLSLLLLEKYFYRKKVCSPSPFVSQDGKTFTFTSSKVFL